VYGNPEPGWTDVRLHVYRLPNPPDGGFTFLKEELRLPYGGRLHGDFEVDRNAIQTTQLDQAGRGTDGYD
jgi:hypothetical protein